MDINKYFNKLAIINNLAKYDTYYQVSLGILVNTTNTKELDFNIKLEYALGSIYEMLKELNEDIDNIFEIELQKQAAMDALQYFANENINAVKNKELDIEDTLNMINDNLFFNQITLDICNENIPNQIKKYEEMISDEVSESIIISLKSLESK
ncbi:hypothetical protein LPB137_05345 [Poseidonibacter parvus]|uniref:Uncharacterized protein n=1 Tax=Poseidonibacter parvus TaxID=1850254 RepID=A0A1P8KL85_9BACT|nr:hypothetical protein [Poseidonibacter parvus]APW65314.1 hypothetical protein LPB137_05345 [Poseidonibacter parvus]